MVEEARLEDHLKKSNDKILINCHFFSSLIGWFFYRSPVQTMDDIKFLVPWLSKGKRIQGLKPNLCANNKALYPSEQEATGFLTPFSWDRCWFLWAGHGGQPLYTAMLCDQSWEWIVWYRDLEENLLHSKV